MDHLTVTLLLGYHSQ